MKLRPAALSRPARTVAVVLSLASVVALAALAFAPSRTSAPLAAPQDPDAVLLEVDADDLSAMGPLPTDPAEVAAAVRHAITRSRETGDLRHLGTARALLSPWWSEPAPPTELLVLRATVRQALHDFDGALADLSQATARAPQDQQAWLTRGMLEISSGRYAQARHSCGQLHGWTQAVCAAAVDSLTGNARRGLGSLQRALTRAAPPTAHEQAWALSMLAEIAIRAGEDDLAARAFEQSLLLDPKDNYTRAAYADLLLDLGRASQALAWVEDHGDRDALLLRKAVAHQALGDRHAAVVAAKLGERLQESRLLDDDVHLREEARFLLEVEKDAGAALEAARRNWRTQREPPDARLVLEAALATGRPEDAGEVIAAIERAGWEEPRLRRLVARLAGGGR